MAAPVTAPMRAEINDEVLLVVLERDFMNHDFHGWEVAEAYDWRRMRTELDASPNKAEISAKLAGFAAAKNNPVDTLKKLIKDKALPIAGTDFAAQSACAGSYWRPASKEKRLLCVLAATDFDASTRISPEVYYARDRLLELLATNQSNVQALQDKLDLLAQAKAAEAAAFNRRLAELQAGSDASTGQLESAKKRLQKEVKKLKNAQQEGEKQHAAEKRRLDASKASLQASAERTQAELTQKNARLQQSLQATQQAAAELRAVQAQLTAEQAALRETTDAERESSAAATAQLNTVVAELQTDSARLEVSVQQLTETKATMAETARQQEVRRAADFAAAQAELEAERSSARDLAAAKAALEIEQRKAATASEAERVALGVRISELAANVSALETANASAARRLKEARSAKDQADRLASEAQRKSIVRIKDLEATAEESGRKVASLKKAAEKLRRDGKSAVEAAAQREKSLQQTINNLRKTVEQKLAAVKSLETVQARLRSEHMALEAAGEEERAALRAEIKELVEAGAAKDAVAEDLRANEAELTRVLDAERASSGTAAAASVAAQEALLAEAAQRAAEFEAAQQKLQGQLAKLTETNNRQIAAMTKKHLGELKLLGVAKDCSAVVLAEPMEFEDVTAAQLQCALQKRVLAGEIALYGRLIEASKIAADDDASVRELLKKMELDDVLGTPPFVHIPLTLGMNKSYYEDFKTAVPVDASGTVVNRFIRDIMAETGFTYEKFAEVLLVLLKPSIARFKTASDKDILKRFQEWRKSAIDEYSLSDTRPAMMEKLKQRRKEVLPPKTYAAGTDEYIRRSIIMDAYEAELQKEADEAFYEELGANSVGRSKYQQVVEDTAEAFKAQYRRAMTPKRVNMFAAPAPAAGSDAPVVRTDFLASIQAGLGLKSTATTGPEPVKLSENEQRELDIAARKAKMAKQSLERRLAEMENKLESPQEENSTFYDPRAAFEAKRKANIVQASADSIFGKKMQFKSPASQSSPPVQTSVMPPPPPAVAFPAPPPPAVAFPAPPPPVVAFPEPPPQSPRQGGRRKRRHALPYL